jgi:hypothetical protein
MADTAQLLGLDWISTATRPYWHAARWSLRTLKFQAHAHLPTLPLPEIVARLGRGSSDAVSLPPATLPTGGVGSPAHYYALGSICQALAPRRVLEIGTFLGVGTLTLALNLPAAGQITTVDLPETVEAGQMESLNATDRGLVRRSRGKIGAAYADHPTASRIVAVRADSTTIKFAELTPNADFIVVDGGHSLAVVRSDSENALSALASEGAILWDDYWWFYPDVVRYLDELSRRVPLVRIADTNLVLHCRRVYSG